MRFRWVVVLTLVAASVLFATAIHERGPQRDEFCVAEVGETRAELDLEQGQWAALIAAVAQKRGLPPRATTIALATAFQESKMHNIDYGDRDSLGLFQQRPSQGWGSAEEILDPHHSIGAFYDALVKVDGYDSMVINDAAQLVQRSGYPTAYAQHEDYARAIASSLRGYSPAKFSCQVNPRSGGSTPAVIDDVTAAFGEIPVIRHDDDASYPLTGDSADVKARGWAIAQYLVGQAASLDISRVSFGGRTWTAAGSADGWVKDAEASKTSVTVSTS